MLPKAQFAAPRAKRSETAGAGHHTFTNIMKRSILQWRLGNTMSYGTRQNIYSLPAPAVSRMKGTRMHTTDTELLSSRGKVLIPKRQKRFVLQETYQTRRQ